jgi:phage baseplate assembly protein W
MASINLDILSNVNSNRNNANVFTDVALDLELDSTYSNQLTKNPQIRDIIADTNLGAIYNSIANIITTNPGQKPLNPIFGISFGQILFLPVTNQRALSIGNAVFTGIQKFEPRVNIINVNVIPDAENNQYTIEITVVVPRFNTQQVKIVGVLDKSGFYLNNN